MKLGYSVLLLACLAGGWFAPLPLWAQPATWREDRVAEVTLLSQPGTAREAVLARVVADHASLSRLVGLGSVDPIVVRLYASSEALLATRPLAVASGALLAYPRRSRREVDVVAASGATDDALAVALRRELAHRALVVRTDGRLAEGFQEGLAAYLAGPASARAEDIAQLRLAWGRDGLRRWAELTAPGAAYTEPALSYPEARSIAQFLADRYGFAALGKWLEATAGGAGWREGLEQAFGNSPDELEQAWQAWLPSYLDGGWRTHALFTPDLGQAEALLSGGDFAAAAALLDALSEAEEWPAGTVAEQRGRLLAAARAGSAAVAALAAAEAALARGDYQPATVDAAKAAAGFRAAGASASLGQAEELLRRGELGASSMAALARAEQLPAWRAIEARGLAAQAAEGLAQLGNDAAAQRAAALAARMDERLRPAGLALAALGLLLLAWNLRRRMVDQRVAWA